MDVCIHRTPVSNRERLWLSNWNRLRLGRIFRVLRLLGEVFQNLGPLRVRDGGHSICFSGMEVLSCMLALRFWEIRGFVLRPVRVSDSSRKTTLNYLTLYRLLRNLIPLGTSLNLRQESLSRDRNLGYGNTARSQTVGRWGLQIGGSTDFLQRTNSRDDKVLSRVNRLLILGPHFSHSITQLGFQWDKQGWGTSLADRYARKADVVLRGYSDYNTCWACELLDRIFPIPSSSTPLLVTVFFGANDAVDPSVKQTIDQHVPLPEYKENRQIVAHLKDQYGDNSGVPARRNEVTKLYAEACVKLGQEEGLPVINLWSIFQEDPDWEDKLLCDGLHLSAEGNAKLFYELVKVVGDPDLVPTLIQNDMPWDFPDYQDLDEDPMDTLRKWCASNLK